MVYVDNMRAPYGRMKMAHMIADTEDELLEMADRIIVNRKWFQSNSSHPHFDISLSKRALAVKHGAVEITRRQPATMLRHYRRTGRLGLPEINKTLQIRRLRAKWNRIKHEKDRHAAPS